MNLGIAYLLGWALWCVAVGILKATYRWEWDVAGTAVALGCLWPLLAPGAFLFGLQLGVMWLAAKVVVWVW